ncbi:Thymidylate synthase [Burkholderia pseudomallei]|uniref:hypothetical protein n=1 Tax=Burkholderia pseudomallei TaxID=28450 RepID=UPI000A65C9A9|nr:hypothetical protein [Burkholderia pseudomallei]
MAKLFDTQERIVPTWLAAARFLDGAPNRRAMNLVLEIADPTTITAEDRQVMAGVDAALQRKQLTLRTVAGTIFPLDLYRRYKRPAFYQHYKDMLKRGKKQNTWGTYFSRMTERPSRDGKSTINPLDMLVERLSSKGQPEGKSFASAYELGIAEPGQDLTDTVHRELGGDVPTYDVAIDGREWLGYPCLSHLSFKRVPSGDDFSVNLTAVYRSHHYCSRALGNLLGLGQLLAFVARESDLKLGTLTCVSTHAELDTETWGGVKVAHKTLGLS